jgi:hypothetical protein
MQQFKLNKYNFVTCGLKTIDATKKRGIIALQHIKAGEIIALFPGSQTFRIPADESAILPMANFEDRHDLDQRLIDDTQEMMPVSDYAILNCVIEYGQDKTPTGYTYAVVDPMMDARPGQMQELLQSYQTLKSLYTGDVVPPEMLPLIRHKAEVLYERVATGGNIRVTAKRTPANPQVFEFFLCASAQERPEDHRIVMYLPDGHFFTICSKSDFRDAEFVKARIEKGILCTFDVKRKGLLSIRDQAKALKLPDDHPYLAPFVNQPYAGLELPNCEFDEPHEWHAKVAQLDASSANPHLVSVINAVKSGADSRRDLLNRTAIVATRDIRPGEEVLLFYNREDESQDQGASSSSAPYRGSLSAYEQERLANIERNRQVLIALGLERPVPPPIERPPPRPRIPKRMREPTRRSDRARKLTPLYVPEEEIPDRSRRPRAPRTNGGGGRACPSLEGFTNFENCSARSRARHMLSATKSYADIDDDIKELVFSRLGITEMPKDDHGNYRFAYRIVKFGKWHWRSAYSGKVGNLGTFCEPELAAFVSNYARAFPQKSREEVWSDLKIVNLDDLTEDCLAETQTSQEQDESSSSQGQSYSLRNRNPTRSSADE